MPDNQRFPIPDELEPPTRCLCLEVPDNEDWLRVFAGLLAQPAYWFNWERDTDRSGKILAQYWTKLYDQIDWSIMSCCCDQPPAIFRYNSDGVYQRSTDGGATWTDAPGYDYRNTSTIFPPPAALGIDNTKCQAADGAVVILNEDVIQGLDNGAAVQALLEFVAAVLIFYLSAGTLATVAIGLFSMAAAIVGFGVASTKAAFTTTVLDQLRCTIFNGMDSDDSIDAGGLAAILVDINTNYTGIVKTSLYSIISAAGVVGITNMLRSNRGDPAADCSGCGCDCTVTWTWFGGTATVDGSNPNLVHFVSDGTGNMAFTSGDDTVGCYCDGVSLFWNGWMLGSMSPVTGVNWKGTRIWNMDAGNPGAGHSFDFLFSDCPIP